MVFASPEAAQVWFDQHEVTRFKWPERVEVIDELPLLGSGKPDKAALRALLTAG